MWAASKAKLLAVNRFQWQKTPSTFQENSYGANAMSPYVPTACTSTDYLSWQPFPDICTIVRPNSLPSRTLQTTSKLLNQSLPYTIAADSILNLSMLTMNSNLYWMRWLLHLTLNSTLPTLRNMSLKQNGTIEPSRRGSDQPIIDYHIDNYQGLCYKLLYRIQQRSWTFSLLNMAFPNTTAREWFYTRKILTTQDTADLDLAPMFRHTQNLTPATLKLPVRLIAFICVTTTVTKEDTNVYTSKPIESSHVGQSHPYQSLPPLLPKSKLLLFARTCPKVWKLPTDTELLCTTLLGLQEWITMMKILMKNTVMKKQRLMKAPSLTTTTTTTMTMKTMMK